MLSAVEHACNCISTASVLACCRPTVESLASASLDEVREAWQGLGYYRPVKGDALMFPKCRTCARVFEPVPTYRLSLLTGGHDFFTKAHNQSPTIMGAFCLLLSAQTLRTELTLPNPSAPIPTTRTSSLTKPPITTTTIHPKAHPTAGARLARH